MALQDSGRNFVSILNEYRLSLDGFQQSSVMIQVAFLKITVTAVLSTDCMRAKGENRKSS